MGKKIKVLFCGWFEIPHSYSICTCFKMIHLYKKYKNKIQIYVHEMPYYRQEWNNSRKLVYSQEYNDIIKSLKVWKGEQIDMIYSITYPYNMTMETMYDKTIPKCVFYTSEFATLEPSYFISNVPLATDQMITEYVKTHEKLYMTAPSIWSAKGMEKYNLPTERNRVITHGVDRSIFHKNRTNRDKTRSFYSVKQEDILMINIGSMTGNKGIMHMLQILNYIVNHLGKTHYKLLLKGTGDLYQSKNFLEVYFEQLQQMNVMNKEQMNNILQNNIIFTDKTLSYTQINDLFNAADLYLSPYLAEGFNLTPLEALSSGLPIMVPETGSTKEYVQDIYTNGGNDHIFYIPSTVIVEQNRHQNNIELQDLLNAILLNENEINEMKTKRFENDYTKMEKFIQSSYSWDHVADLLYDYFKVIISA
jgi:glycosyltransferase involved in cell wall biosynthesis